MTHLKSALVLAVLTMVFGPAHSVITYTMPAKCDQAYAGFDVTGLAMSSPISNVRSVEHCAFMCSNFNGCECYVWNRVAQLCYLRSDCWYNTKAPSSALISGKCGPPKFTFPATCQRQYDQAVWIAPSVSLSNQINNVDSIEECATICSTFDKCECYTYFGAPGRSVPHCYLYRNCQLRGPDIRAISGTCTPRTITLPVAPTMKPTPKPTPKPTLKPVAPNSGRYVKCCQQQAANFKTGSYQDARNACKSEGDDMATIFDSTQNARAATACEGASPGCWTGLKSDASGNFAWMDGTAMTYNQFAAGEPLIRLNACVYIDPNSQGQWKTAPCGTALPSICEVPFGFAAAVGETAIESFSNGWMIAVVCGVVLCCIVVVVPCVVLGRIKDGETTPLLTKS